MLDRPQFSRLIAVLGQQIRLGLKFERRKGRRRFARFTRASASSPKLRFCRRWHLLFLSMRRFGYVEGFAFRMALLDDKKTSRCAASYF